MECALQEGTVLQVLDAARRQELKVQVGSAEAAALNYPDLLGPCRVGDRVLLNTTASELKLGSGGWHYVLAIWGRGRSLSKQGHIMKLRYTPLQGRVLSVEEEQSPHHKTMLEARSLAGLPVAVGSLHSMLAPLAWGLGELQAKKLVYLMSDGAALPLALSNSVELLKERSLLQGTITFGHAFGGDLEAVNVYSALLAAKHVLKADLAVILMGPGVVGTSTKWGTSALEQGIFLNAAAQLGGKAVAIPRLSEADPRPRHRGLSHHTRTVLQQVVQNPVLLPLPRYFQNFSPLQAQIGPLSQLIRWENTEQLFRSLAESRLPLTTMGRGPKQDPLFFHGVLAAAASLSALGA